MEGRIDLSGIDGMVWSMKSFCLSLLLVSSSFAADWPQWRGPDKNNHAAVDAKPVTEWSAEKNVRWKTKIPGRGHSTPIVVGERIYLTTAEKDKALQWLIAVNRKDGKIVWKQVIHKGGFPTELHRENSAASATPQWTGSAVLVTFQNKDQVKVTAVTPEGETLWTKTAGHYDSGRPFGYGSTPVLWKGSFIVAGDTEEKGYLVSLDAKSGEQRWRIERGGHDNWASPVVAKVAGKEQLLISGMGKIWSYDPANGKENWTAPHAPQATCGTIVWTDEMVFASGGFPNNETLGVKADGSSEVVWKNRERSYEQSLLSHKGLIYAVTDQGFAFCWDAKTGETKWKKRLGRGGVMASPLAVGDHIYATIKNGTTTVFKAGAKFEKVAENKLGDDTYASPVVLGDALYLRVGHVKEGERQEMLYCIGK